MRNDSDQSTALPALPSPKQPQGENKRDWYPYYAGFRREFAEQVWSSWMSGADSIVDPWNGSGTTTELAARHGMQALGVDLNPAMFVIAAARLLPSSERPQLQGIAQGLLTAVEDLEVPALKTDPLGVWLRTPSVRFVRALVCSILHRFGDPLTDENEHVGLQLDQLRSSFFLSAAMAAVRDVLVPFRSSNPSWMRTPSSPSHKIAPSIQTLSKGFLKRCEYLSDRLSLHETSVACDIWLQHSNALDGLGDRKWGSCLTSPPYATRIDYVRANGPELAVLGIETSAQQCLREAMTGSPVVKKKRSASWTAHSPIVRSVLDRVGQHESHGSANYYLPWLTNYFHDLEATIDLIDKGVADGGAIALVVQDSYYKEIHLDLQAVVTEMLERNNRSLVVRVDFPAPHLMSRVNSRAQKHKTNRAHHESLIVVR